MNIIRFIFGIGLNVPRKDGPHSLELFDHDDDLIWIIGDPNILNLHVNIGINGNIYTLEQLFAILKLLVRHILDLFGIPPEEVEAVDLAFLLAGVLGT